ncbi:4a-hydroxytetrahydrobiopterin dehydratase [Streptomyces sp. BP-8]|uniref:Putative pterin-4-alpha-carbinolamine dehydratase n=1 Tax=Streptomyces sirii TaxID=3127701 RepID=A0ABZ2QF27_9ACTN
MASADVFNSPACPSDLQISDQTGGKTVPRVLDDSEIEDRMSGAEMREWRRDGNVLRRTIEAHDFPTVVRMLERIVVDTQRLDRRPDIDIRGGVVHFTLYSDAGLTDVKEAS